jgi:hypothetical protein
MTVLQLLTASRSPALADLLDINELSGAPCQSSGWDNRPTWDNVGGGGFDNRPTWDNWSKR